MTTLPPLSLYVHLPWCVSKCPYCDFNSHTAGDAAPRERYLEAVCADLKAEAKRAGTRQLISVFIGGGTPSLFTGSEIGQLLDAVAAAFSLACDIEITMEANPGTVERGNLCDYANAGVNRLSLGAQSFNAESLKRLGRIHGPEEIHVAFDDAVSAGFASINLDIMFSLPGQNIAMAIADAERATSLAPAHISHYQLTLEPNTVFHSEPPADLPGEEDSLAMQQRCHDIFAAQDYEHYEISAFAKAGHRSRHNLNYWTYGDYLGVGAGAHGKLTSASGIKRYQKPRHPLSFIEQAEGGRIEDRECELSESDLSFEFMLNALRLPEGFRESEFIARTGLTTDTIETPLKEAESKGMIALVGDAHWRPTRLGLRFLNDLTGLFLP